MNINKILIIILVLCVSSVLASWDAVSGKSGMVATADKYATKIGIEILKKGGNAIDAAVAVGFTLAVTYPRAGNIGGGGFMIIRSNDNDFFALDYREKAPIKAFKDMYLDKDKKIIDRSSLEGYLASGVPGSVCGLYDAHQRFGSLSWEELIQPAIDFAKNGIILDRNTAESLQNKYNLFMKFPASAEIFTKNGEKFLEGDTLIQNDLSLTLSRIRDQGKSGFYNGKTAELIEQDMSHNGGIIAQEDLREYNAIWREPVHFTYRNYNVYSMPPPSSGCIVLAEILNTIENYDISSLGIYGSNLMHIWAETEKYAYADRAEYLGDADFIDIPIDKLISKEYAYSIYKKINPYFATPSVEIGNKQFHLPESEQTTHFSIVDKWGNAVSNTTTLNNSYGSGVVIAGTGILMNNEMDDFSIKAGAPNMYGLVGSNANEIVAEKRMLSSMTPTIITKEDTLVLILGTPGGSTIITSVAQVISNIIDHQMNVRNAVEAARFHHQWLPDEIKYEKNRFPKDVLNNLKNLGHLLKPVNSIGDIQAILWNKKYTEWQGWSDPRGNGLTKGY